MERTGGSVENAGADSSLVVWSLLIFCLLSGPATGAQHAHCSEFLCLSPPSPLVRLLSFSSEQGPCGSPLDLSPPPGLPGLAPGPVAWSPLCPTVVIVPGRRPARLQPSWARVMAGELLEAGLVNVLVADWLLPPEQEITEGARQVGERLAQAIQTLQEDQDVEVLVFIPQEDQDVEVLVFIPQEDQDVEVLVFIPQEDQDVEVLVFIPQEDQDVEVLVFIPQEDQDVEVLVFIPQEDQDVEVLVFIPQEDQDVEVLVFIPQEDQDVEVLMFIPQEDQDVEVLMFIPQEDQDVEVLVFIPQEDQDVEVLMFIPQEDQDVEVLVFIPQEDQDVEVLVFIPQEDQDVEVLMFIPQEDQDVEVLMFIPQEDQDVREDQDVEVLVFIPQEDQDVEVLVFIPQEDQDVEVLVFIPQEDQDVEVLVFIPQEDQDVEVLVFIPQEDQDVEVLVFIPQEDQDVEVLMFIPQEDQGSSPELFHLVGFGVGAHVAGVAGACLEGAIGRITGLDPFSPLFSEADRSLSLDPTDAQYVDVIHTNFNPNEPVAPLGVSRPLGHVDFYIGRGHQLPGCPQALMKREDYLLCSHHRAYRLFTSSIRSSCPLTAFPCQGVEDFQRALCTRCHHPGLNTCPRLGKIHTALPQHLPPAGCKPPCLNTCPQLGKYTLPCLNTCPQLGYDISWLPPDRPITFQPLTAVLDITATDPFCGQELRTHTHTHTDSVTQLQSLEQLREQFVTPFLLEVHLEGNVSLGAQLFIQLKGHVRKTPVMLVSGPPCYGVQNHVTSLLLSTSPVLGLEEEKHSDQSSDTCTTTQTPGASILQDLQVYSSREPESGSVSAEGGVKME
ncbi:unnamed protein product [Coregonus sp. 'balchen']|nr:unnamed protein product [Coregonus sp. 'balchen']